MKVVITGPTGAVGRALIDLCLDNQIEVLAICHKNSLRAKTLPASSLLRVIYCDMDAYETVSAEGNFDYFFHLAWMGTTGGDRNNTMLQEQNIKYSLDAVRLANRLGCKAFIGAGSQAEYGRIQGKMTESSATFPESGYGIAKLCAGQLTRMLCESLQMRHVWVRILSVYGPYDGRNSLISTVIAKLLANEVPELTLGGQMWDYLFSRDAACALLKLAQRGKHGSVYPLGSGNVRPLKEYILTIKNMINPQAGLDFGAVPYAPKQVMWLQADIEALKEDTGYCPDTSFETGIQETIKWAKDNLI